jgi:hypothetical protein
VRSDIFLSLIFVLPFPNLTRAFRGSRAFTDSENQLQTPLSPEAFKGQEKAALRLQKKRCAKEQRQNR